MYETFDAAIVISNGTHLNGEKATAEEVEQLRLDAIAGYFDAMWDAALSGALSGALTHGQHASAIVARSVGAKNKVSYGSGGYKLGGYTADAAATIAGGEGVAVSGAIKVSSAASAATVRATTNSGMGGVRAAATAAAKLPSGRQVPEGWVPRVADNGKGTVFQRRGAQGNADMIRIMDPTAEYSDGYVRVYNSHGQPVDVNGKPGPRPATHIPLGGSDPWNWWPS
jgi:hypothetical protein